MALQQHERDPILAQAVDAANRACDGVPVLQKQVWFYYRFPVRMVTATTPIVMKSPLRRNLKCADCFKSVRSLFKKR
jgi:hypothetical protein